MIGFDTEAPFRRFCFSTDFNSKNMKPMTYASTGVNYDALDAFKRQALKAGLGTANDIERFGGIREVPESRGESAYVIETPSFYVAHVEEGLGTKNLVADKFREEIAGANYERLLNKSFYDSLAQCTVAMIVNDLITVGALPMTVLMHLAVGDSSWFSDELRSRELVEGWARACRLSRATYGGGETPTLKGVVIPGAALLGGSAWGIIAPKSRRITPAKIEEGDVIVLFHSSGIHANGLTLARKIAGQLSQGYLTELSDGRTYGEALLEPTVIYAALIEECFKLKVDVHYAINVTGHGWRKLMRAPQDWTYVIDTLPKQNPLFDFVQEHGPVDDREAYANLNMGAGFAVIVSEDNLSHIAEAVKLVPEVARWGYTVAGRVEKGERKVVIRPKDIEYRSDELAVR
jgi:phosphoribosylformylglycinamidine cyclo-ligase